MSFRYDIVVSTVLSLAFFLSSLMLMVHVGTIVKQICTLASPFIRVSTSTKTIHGVLRYIILDLYQ